MSNETKTKEKVDMDPKYILKLTLTLLVTCVIVAGVLGFVNSITKDKIEAFNLEKTNTALSNVYQQASAPQFEETDVTDAMTAAASSYSATLKNVYKVTDGGSDAGYAVKIVAAGSQGDIEMVVGVDTDGAVTGVSIVKNSETSGIGSKVMKILIGPENISKALLDTSVVVASYDIGDNMRGLIGVVGPTRMDYASVTARLSYFAEGMRAETAVHPATCS